MTRNQKKAHPDPNIRAIRAAILDRLKSSPWLELRAIWPGGSSRPEKFWVGREDDLAAAAAWAATKNREGFAVYATFNVINEAPRGYAKDADVSGRAKLFIDIDPERPTNTSATDAQKLLAAAVADSVRADLARRGWGEPAERHDSGNGLYLYYVCEPGIDTPAVKALLAALQARHGTESVKIDTSVCNSARISRLPGTVNTKGKVHRLCRVLARNADPITVTSAMVADASSTKPRKGNGLRRRAGLAGDNESRATAYLQ